MHIAIVTTSWPATEGDPAGHFVRASARDFQREGHRVDVLTPRAGNAFGWPGVAARVRERPTRALEAAYWVLRARARVARLGADLAIAHWALPCGWPIATAARCRLQVVSHGGDVRLLARLPSAVRRRVCDAITARAERWTFVSERLRDELFATLDFDTRGRVGRMARVEAPAIELPDVREAVGRLRLELAGTRTAVVVGRLVASKHVERAIEHVARAHDIDTLVVVGDGPERGRLEKLARAANIEVRFVGNAPRGEALAWIGAAEALLHASSAEGLSTVVREANALGTRVVRL